MVTRTIGTHERYDAQAPRDILSDICRQGAQEMLMQALDNEVREYLEAHAPERDETGRRMVVRNGHLPKREILTGAGALEIRQARVRDKRPGVQFTSRILPPYMRRAPSIDALVPALYLKGVSTGDFTDALSAILGEGAAGLSATNVVRLKKVWEDE